MIYFIRDTASGNVKIGFSDDPWRRLGKIQSDCPGEVEMLSIIDGGVDVEAALHERFSDCRLRGEWFSCVGALAAYLADLPRSLRPERERKAHVVLIERLSLATGVGGQTARSWLDRNAIPAGHWLAVSRAGIMTLEELAERHAIVATDKAEAA